MSITLLKKFFMLLKFNVFNLISQCYAPPTTQSQVTFFIFSHSHPIFIVFKNWVHVWCIHVSDVCVYKVNAYEVCIYDIFMSLHLWYMCAFKCAFICVNACALHCGMNVESEDNTGYLSLLSPLFAPVYTTLGWMDDKAPRILLFLPPISP